MIRTGTGEGQLEQRCGRDWRLLNRKNEWDLETEEGTRDGLRVYVCLGHLDKWWNHSWDRKC